MTAREALAELFAAREEHVANLEETKTTTEAFIKSRDRMLAAWESARAILATPEPAAPAAVAPEAPTLEQRTSIAITEEALRNNPSATLTTTAAPAEAPPALPENLIDGTGCDYMRGYAAAERDNASLQADEERARVGWDFECDDLDRVLTRLGFDPQAYRTDGGRLNRQKLESALAERDAQIGELRRALREAYERAAKVADHDNVIDLGKKPKRRIVIEDEWIYVYGFHPEYSDKARAMKLDMTCRTVANEACAWAVKRLGEEMEKSLAYYHTGEPIDKICIE